MDLEAYADEWRMVPPLFTIMFACRLFEIDLLAFAPQQSGSAMNRDTIAGEAIKLRRETLGLSEPEFADRCGFHSPFTPVVETGDGLLLYPFEVTCTVCKVLELNLSSFTKHVLLSPR
jgi:hypothetical protein